MKQLLAVKSHRLTSDAIYLSRIGLEAALPNLENLLASGANPPYTPPVALDDNGFCTDNQTSAGTGGTVAIVNGDIVFTPTAGFTGRASFS